MASMLHQWPGKTALALFLYCIAAYFSLYLINVSLPPILEKCIVAFVMPLQLLSLPLLPLLKTLGGTHGTWQVAPNLWGVVLIAGIYAAVVLIIGKVVR